MHLQVVPSGTPAAPSDSDAALRQLLADGVTWGDSSEARRRIAADVDSDVPGQMLGLG